MGDKLQWIILDHLGTDFVASLRRQLTSLSSFDDRQGIVRDVVTGLRDADRLNDRFRRDFTPTTDVQKFHLYFIGDDDGALRVKADGLAVKLNWNGDPQTLKNGWSGAIRAAFDQQRVVVAANALVGLRIFVRPKYRKQQIPALFINKFRQLAKELQLNTLILPTLPSSRRQRETAGMPFEQFARLRRDDGLSEDPWFRFHERCGAVRLLVEPRSHRWACSVDNFRAFFSSTPLQSGDAVVRFDGFEQRRAAERGTEELWYQVYADLERDIVIWDEGCVWYQYGLE